jgi:hypothetical protein
MLDLAAHQSLRRHDLLTLEGHLAAAARLVDAACATSTVLDGDCDDRDLDLDRVVDVTVRAAFVSMQQLHIALRLTLESAERAQLVLRVVDRAGLDAASSEAVGAASMVLEAVRCDGLDHAVRVAAHAAALIGPRALLDGSVALVASLSVEIAELLAIEPAAVSAEIVRLVVALPPGPVVPCDDRRRPVELAVARR